MVEFTEPLYIHSNIGRRRECGDCQRRHSATRAYTLRNNKKASIDTGPHLPVSWWSFKLVFWWTKEVWPTPLAQFNARRRPGQSLLRKERPRNSTPRTPGSPNVCFGGPRITEAPRRRNSRPRRAIGGDRHELPREHTNALFYNRARFDEFSGSSWGEGYRAAVIATGAKP